MTRNVSWSNHWWWQQHKICMPFNPVVVVTIGVERFNSYDYCADTRGKWNESDFRPPLCTYRLNWARRTSRGWWDDWDDTVLQTQDSKFEPWRSEVAHAISQSPRLPTILTFTRGWGRNIFVSFKPPKPGTEPRTLAWKAAVLTTTLGPPHRHARWKIWHWHIYIGLRKSKLLTFVYSDLNYSNTARIWNLHYSQ